MPGMRHAGYCWGRSSTAESNRPDSWSFLAHGPDPGTLHFWGSELLYVPSEPGQHYRHNDLMYPLWNMFDVTPEGRGDFEPKLDDRSAI